MPIRRLGVLTGGGDAPGLNAVIRAVVLAATRRGVECAGIEDSFHGLVAPSPLRPLTPDLVDPLLRLGGTVLGTTNTGDPFASGTDADRCLDHAKSLGLDAVVAIGGDGTLSIAHAFAERGLAIVGVPKTIDHDIAGTDSSFGFDTAVAAATDAIDRVRGSAEAHHRVMVVEVMGHHAGWLALSAGLAGGADVVLIPEIRFDLDRVRAHLDARAARGARASLLVVADEARSNGAGLGAGMDEPPAVAARRRDIARRLADTLERATGREARYLVAGHVQRGSPPTAFDRVLATRLGSFAVDLAADGRFGLMTALRGDTIVPVPLADMVHRTQPMRLDADLIRTARGIGICLGG
jgi:6-phosphofructokinase 1